MTQLYSAVYRQMCQEIEAYAETRIGRPLTGRERRGIGNAGSTIALEAIERGLIAARMPQGVADQLAELASASPERMARAIESLAGQLGSLLGRTLVPAEQARLAGLTSMYDTIRIAEQVAAADPAERETVLALILDELAGP